ncbi:hypothetical protein SUGI_0136880 [Cryptomeria japonica]|uniref:late embryogenis abundant protein 41 n=1 Tax=Cryptomeria japonica TaxID=3369 RepID=UPI002408BE48|nr:late embryogenis abundant protein 41 [Cryptomeria japonica]GLJ10867.1 hypothetical protein SUGI_0136880 [Cryptomeria japonica]
MARFISVLDLKAFSRLCGHDFGFENIARRQYGAMAGKMELRGVQAEVKETDEKSRQRSWMPHPITGYYLPEDHFGDKDIPLSREKLFKSKTLPSRPKN